MAERNTGNSSAQSANSSGSTPFGANIGSIHAGGNIHGGVHANQAQGNINYSVGSQEHHHIFNNQNNQGRMLGGPVYGGNVSLGDTHNTTQNARDIYNNQNNQGRMVGGPVHGGTTSLGDAHNSPQNARLNEITDDQGLHKAWEEFFKKYLSKEAIDNLPGRPYPMGRKGKMLVINNEIWPKDLCDENGAYINLDGRLNRDGTDKDRDALKELSKHIEFGNAVVKENRTVEQMKEDLNKFATEQDWKNLDAAIVCILSHGGENNVIYGTENFTDKLEMSEILQAFSQQNGNCKYLQGKPKIFIIQACRGGKYDNRKASNDGLVEGDEKSDLESAEDLFRSAYSVFADVIPSAESKADSNYKSQAADILVLWATGWGFLAWRNRLTGSYFIQELIKAIMDKSEEHMIEIMEHVIRAVKEHFQAGIKQPGECPQFLSSLDRKLYLM